QEVGGGEIIVAGNSDQRSAQLPGHILHEACLAAAGWPFEHDGEMAVMALFEYTDFTAGGDIVRRLLRRILHALDRLTGVSVQSFLAQGRLWPLECGHKDAPLEAPRRSSGAVACSSSAPKDSIVRGGVRKKSQMNRATPTTNMLPVATSIRKCTWILC